MPHYNSDYMHCSQSACNKKDKCWRYWLGQHCKGIASFYYPSEPKTEGCEHFLNVKDY